MPAPQGTLSPSITGDGDLGLFAMQSRSPSTSFDTSHEARARAAADLTAIPTYPSPTPASFSTMVSHASPSPSNSFSVPPPDDADKLTQQPRSEQRVNQRVAHSGNSGTPSSDPHSSLTSSSTSSRLAALSLHDELSRNSSKTVESRAASSASPASAISTSTRDNLHVQSTSISSASSIYNSAAESPISASVTTGLPSSSTSSSATSARLEKSQSSSSIPSTAPPPSFSQHSIASTSTITPSRLPTSRSLASHLSGDKQAISLEQELDADADFGAASTATNDAESRPRKSATSPRSSRRSRRSVLPAPQDRLPVGEGGPQAPPRNTSFRDASKRLSAGLGHGDLGVDPYAASGVGPSSPSMTSFLDLESPRSSESSTTGRYTVPSRRTSLHASSPTQALHPLDPPRSASSAHAQKPKPATAIASAAHPFAAQPSSRPISSDGKATLAAASTPAAKSTDKAGSTTPVSTLNLDREAMQRWVLSVGCVNFDLELGPDLEFLYPPLGISREERDNIAFSSFPDTSIFDDGSLVFSWRVREVPLDSSGSEPPTIKSLNDALQPGTTLDEETPRPSMNKAALHNALAMAQKQRTGAGKRGAAGNLSAPTSPISPATSGFKDSSASSTTSSNALSRQPSEANLQSSGSHSMATLPSTTSFHERLTQKLFPSSGPTGMARHFSHDRHSSTHSMSSAASLDDDADGTTSTSQSASTVASNASPAGSSIVPSSSVGTQSSDLIHPRRTATGGNSTSSSYIYGYVFFRQKRDPTNRRGYFQKSVVILSHLPLVGLFSEVVARLGPLYFEHGMSMFEAFANDIMSWPPPQPGTILTLPLLGSIITAAIPFGQQPQNSPNAESAPMLTSLSSSSANSSGSGFRNAAATMTMRSRSRQASANGHNRELPEPLIGPEGPLLASIPSTTLFETFKEALADLWLLWECVLLAEPILVIAPEPKIASEAVWHMLDLIRPIPYAGDFRPYFHIHDYDFRTLVTKNKPQAGTLIAATNPFFATACRHWPHVLRVGKAAVKLITIKQGSGGGGSGGIGAAGKKVGGGNGGVVGAGGGIGGGHGAGGGGPDHIPGFTTKRKRRISKDRQLLKRLQDLAASCAKSGTDDAAVAAAVCAANVSMRRYFADLTERFLSPLNRYVASLVPASFDLSSPAEAPRIRPFNTVDFLASLKAHGTPLAIRSRSLPTGASVRQSLYVDFLKCPNFSLWLHSRVAAAEEEQRRRYIASLLHGDVTAFGHTRGEIETIDLYSRLVEEIRLVDVQLTAPTEPGPGSRWRTDSPHSASANKTPSRVDSGRNTPTSSHLMSSSANTASTTEKRLQQQKSKLLVQLDKLCQTLPADLRSSLRPLN